MIIAGRKFNVYVDEIPVTQLEPDLEQPRRYEIELELQSRGLDTTKARLPEGIEMATRFEELVRAIIENKGLSMPLVVEKLDGRYKVIDGDRRLGAVRHILNSPKLLEENPELKEHLSKLPCLVVEGPLSEEERLRLLAHIHIHLAQWRPAAKGYVMSGIRQLVGEERTAAIMGVPPGSITKQTAIEELARRFAFKGPQAISYARELASIKRTLIDEKVVDVTVQKVRENKIRSPVELRKLRQILADPDAREVYLSPLTSIEDAEDVLKDKEFKKALSKPSLEFKELLNRLVYSLKGVTFDELVKYKGSAEVKELVEEAIRLLSSFKGYI